YPNDYRPGNKYPMMLMIHGGPFHIDLAEWQSNTYSLYPYQLMAQKGAFVLAPNYHGSSEYGLDFARSIRNRHFYDYPVRDIENAVSRLVELGMVDGNRLGTLGWSNGSILSHALIAQDRRFKAASCGAGGNEWLSEWGAATEGYALLEYYFGASPIEDPGLYKDAAMAPFYNAREVKTPVVMYQGDADTNVVPGMTWTAYRGLQKYSKAPVELYIFPGEGHDPIQHSHQKRKLTEDIKWFDKYLFNSKT
ncbi:MAG: alpha/beta hydrolase family protein, partial [Candidatus Geothermincolia bacterium]